MRHQISICARLSRCRRRSDCAAPKWPRNTFSPTWPSPSTRLRRMTCRSIVAKRMCRTIQNWDSVPRYILQTVQLSTIRGWFVFSKPPRKPGRFLINSASPVEAARIRERSNVHWPASPQSPYRCRIVTPIHRSAFRASGRLEEYFEIIASRLTAYHSFFDRGALSLVRCLYVYVFVFYR